MTQVNCAPFDSIRLVQERRTLSGAVPVAGLAARLVGSLYDSSGKLTYDVRGAVDRQERPLLELHVSGAVTLQCQRCMAGFEHPLEISTAVRLVAAEVLDQEYDDDPDEPDCVAASTAFDLAALIEDEVLLALPAYPRHQSGPCAARAGRVVEAANDAREVADGTTVSAFSVLAALKLKDIQSKE